MDQLGEFITQYLASNELSMRALAQQMGGKITHSRISKVINGANPPNMDFIERLSNVTGVDAGTLANKALGRPSQAPTDVERTIMTVAQLRNTHQIVWDILVLLLKNVNNSAALEAVLKILKEAGE